MSVLSENIIENAIEIIRSQLKAHESDLEEELSTSEEGKAQIVFKLTVQRVDKDRCLHKLSTRIPRQAIKPDDIAIDERQAAIPFKAVAK